MAVGSVVVLIDFIILFVIGLLLIIWSALNKGAAILLHDTSKEVEKRHKWTRLSSAIRVAAIGMIVLGFMLALIYVGGVNSTKLDSNGVAITTEWWRWLGILAFYLGIAYMYLEYTATHTEDRWFTLVLVFLAGLGGTYLSGLAPEGTNAQVIGFVFTGVAIIAAAVSALVVTNIRMKRFPTHYLVWFLVFVAYPIIQYVLLIVGPEGERVISREHTAIGYVCMDGFTAFVAPGMVMLTFFAGRKISFDFWTYRLQNAKQRRPLAPQDMTTPMKSMLNVSRNF